MRSASLTMPRSFPLALTTGRDVIRALDSTVSADLTVVPRGTVIASLLMTSRTNIGGSSHRRVAQRCRVRAGGSRGQGPAIGGRWAGATLAQPPRRPAALGGR